MREWAEERRLERLITIEQAKLIKMMLRDMPRSIVDILPRECRSRISMGTGLFVLDKVIKKSVGFHALDMERKTDQSVNKTVEQITDLFFSGNSCPYVL